MTNKPEPAAPHEHNWKVSTEKVFDATHEAVLPAAKPRPSEPLSKEAARQSAGTYHSEEIGGLFPGAAAPVPVVARPSELHDQQMRMVAWGVCCFGAEHMSNPAIRGLRLVEEAIEFCQSVEVPHEQIQSLVKYVYARDKGVPNQELGGVGVTWLAAAHALGKSAGDLLEAEITRVEAKSPEHFTARNQAKLDAGFDAAPLRSVERSREPLRCAVCSEPLKVVDGAVSPCNECAANAMGSEIFEFLKKDFTVSVAEDYPQEWPEELAEKPIARFHWYEDRGDYSVGITGWAGFVLTNDQSGTWIEAALSRSSSEGRARADDYSRPCADDCSRCSGEYCETHGTDPCDCDSEERHRFRAEVRATGQEEKSNG